MTQLDSLSSPPGQAPPSASRFGRTWADVVYFALEQFRSQLTALIGFPLIVATLVFAWKVLSPDIQAVGAIVANSAKITDKQGEILDQQSQMLNQMGSLVGRMELATRR